MKSSTEFWISSICQQGMARQNIEDCILIRNRTHERYVIIGVSDGMGGLEHGETACAEVCEVFNSPIVGAPGSNLLEKAIMANEKLFSKKDKQGATLSAVALDKKTNTFSALSIGDSRIYKHTALKLIQLSTDDKPLLGGNQVPTNVISKAIGIRENITDLNIITGELTRGDSLLLTTDGIHSFLGKDDIRETIQLFNKTKVTSELATQAVHRGSNDDIAAVYLVTH